MNGIKKLKLAGGPDKTVTWIWLEKGHLQIELYDFSELAQQMFGNDIAYIITVNQMDRLFSLSQTEEESMIQWMAENFKSYFGIKNWLEENKIEFSIERESWA
jgi:hypothetical protein